MDGDRTLLSPARRRADRARLADEVVDVLVIGGGVTGAGAALDAASRGLSVGLLEARDWASGTSSRSSKLIHGGLRYLEQLAFPGLRGDVVRGAIRYWDAQVDDARHTLAVVRTAAGYGARVLSSARVVGLLRDGDGAVAPVVGVEVADLTDGSS